MDPANLSQTQGLFQQAQTPPFQGGAPRLQAMSPGGQIEDGIAQALFSSRQLTPDGMKIQHSVPPQAAQVNALAQQGLSQSASAPNQTLIGENAPGLPSPQEIAMRRMGQ
jgi:hypothetical protein